MRMLKDGARCQGARYRMQDIAYLRESLAIHIHNSLFTLAYAMTVSDITLLS